MILKSRFEVGDDIVVVHGNKVSRQKITKINVEVTAITSKVYYEFIDSSTDKAFRKDEKYCFKDKDEYLNFVKGVAI